MYPLMAWELTKHLAHIALLLCKISCWLTVLHSLLPTHLLLHILFLPLVLLVLFLPWVCLCSSHPLPATLQTSPSFKYFTFFTVGLLKPSLQFQWGTHFSSSPKDILPNNLKLLSPHDSVMCPRGISEILAVRERRTVLTVLWLSIHGTLFSCV